MRIRLLSLALLVLVGTVLARDDKSLTPEQARKQVGKKVTLVMKVETAKDRLEKRGEIYLDADEDFKSEKNFAVVITRTGAKSLQEAGIDDPAVHFKNKKVRVRGTVKEVEGVPRIEIEDGKQISIVEEK